MLVSVVVRTLNEEAYLGELLEGICKQRLSTDLDTEVVIVDSGSTDRTLNVARQWNCRITHIASSEFSFGRSLNLGCDFAVGDLLVFVSGHCVPVDRYWLSNLVAPLIEGVCEYSYGRQIGKDPTKYSEKRVFLKYYPVESTLPQEGFFTNNANAAVKRSSWEQYRFDEELSGLEDMDLAKRFVSNGLRIGYVAEAVVFHIHDESWKQIQYRFEREAFALAKIMPEAGLSFIGFIECAVRSVVKDSYAAMRRRELSRNLTSIIAFRLLQYWGSYRGSRIGRLVARIATRSYFLPDKHFTKPSLSNYESRRITTDEGSQQSSSR